MALKATSIAYHEMKIAKHEYKIAKAKDRFNKRMMKTNHSIGG